MKELIVNGKPLPIHFGMKAIDQYTKRYGIEFQEAVSTTTFLGGIETIVGLTATGLNEGARRSGKIERYSEDDVWDMLDDDPALILTVSEIFVESIVPLADKLGSIAKNESRLTEKKRK